MGTLTKAGIIEQIHEKTDSHRHRSEIKEIVEFTLDMMKEVIKNDHELLISGFGKFEAYSKKTRRGRNPQTAKEIVLPSRKVIVYRLSRKFRAELNGE